MRPRLGTTALLQLRSALAAFVRRTSQALPPVVASHFAASGAANGFMPRDAYMLRRSRHALDAHSGSHSLPHAGQIQTVLKLLVPALSICLASLTTALAAGDQEKGKANLEIMVSGAADSHGQIRIAMFSSDDATLFPERLPALKQTAAAKSQGAAFLFKDLPYGDYAIVVFHDQNDNNVLDRNFLGAPKERWGVSGKRPRFGPPRYAESKFSLTDPYRRLNINME